MPITFVFRPGGKKGDNVYTDFADLSQDLACTEGLKILEFDDSNVSPIVLPRGTFPMNLVSWTGSAPRVPERNHARIVVPDGCFLPGLRMISGQVMVECSADTPPVADFENGARLIQLGLRLDDGIPFLYCTGGASFFDLGSLANTSPPQCVIVVAGHWGEAQDASIIVTRPPARVTTGNVFFRLLPFGSIGKNMMDAAPGTSVTLDWYGGIEGAEQSTVKGNFTIRNAGYRSRNRIMPQTSVAGEATEGAITAINGVQTGDLLVFKPQGNTIVQTLPLIVGSYVPSNPKSTLGHQVLVKNTGIGVVELRPAGADTIDRSFESVFLGSGESCVFESDGVSRWYVVSFSPAPPRTPPS